MKKLCIDTSAYSRFKLGQTEVVQLISECRFVGMPAIVLGELRAGFRLGSKYEQNEDELRQFLDNDAVHILDVDDEASACYAEIFADLRRKGKPIPTNDLWIAAIAMREAATVVTFDAHFDQIQQIAKLRLSQ
jgi:tRNA(fMet)-specific endonuclease VapC